MKLTNFLLIILIGIVAFQKFPEKKKRIISKKDKPIIVIGKRKTKAIIPKVKNKNKIRHSTTFRSYFDTDGRNTIGINHNVRIGKNYYITGGITARNNSFNEEEIGVNISITKYW